ASGVSQGTGALLVENKLVLAGILLALGLSWVVWRARPESDARGATAAPALALVEPASSAAQGARGPALEGAGTVPARELAAGPIASGTWVVRGHAFGKRGEPMRGLPIVGRVWAGPRALGEPVLEARFSADPNGDFAWAIDPPAELELVKVEAFAAGAISS